LRKAACVGATLVGWQVATVAIEAAGRGSFCRPLDKYGFPQAMHRGNGLPARVCKGVYVGRPRCVAREGSMRREAITRVFDIER